MNRAIAEEAVHIYIRQAFKDPDSVKDLDIGTPHIGKYFRGLVNGGGYNYDWVIPFVCNAKNSYGGYTGLKMYDVHVTNGQVTGGNEEPTSYY